MKNATLLSLLEQIGLSEKQARVYFTSLGLGPSTVSEISKASDVKRTTAYSIIGALTEKRLLRLEVHGVKELWQAAEPEMLRVLLDEQQEALNKALPELTARHQLPESESVIKYYDGMEDLKSVYLEMIALVKPGEDYMVLADHELWLNLDPTFFTEFRRRRAKLNIRVRQILKDSPTTRKTVSENRKGNEENRVLPKNRMFTTNLVIIPRRVLVHQLQPPIMGMVIENPQMIQMHREMYELIWEGIPEENSRRKTR